MKVDYQKIQKIISQWQYTGSELALPAENFKKKKSDFMALQEVVLFEDLWIAFFLPSDVSRLEKHKEQYIQYVGKDIYDIKMQTLEVVSSKTKLKEISEIVNPFNRVNNVVIVFLLELIFALKQKKIDQSLIKNHCHLWTKMANHFGLWKIRYVLEDTIFENLHSVDYVLIKSLLTKEEKIHKKLFDEIASILKFHFDKADLKNVEILYRKKNAFGIYQKMQIKGTNINHITDFFGFRIIVNTEEKCYQVRDILHYLWPAYLDRYKNYIKNPKKNQYQSIHTTLSCLEGQIVEFQIRTRDMDYVAKFGPASHEIYKQKQG